MYVHEGRHEFHRSAVSCTVLHLTRAVTPNYGTVPQRASCRPDVPDHEDTADTEAGETFHRTAVPRIHSADQLQGTTEKLYAISVS